MGVKHRESPRGTAKARPPEPTELDSILPGAEALPRLARLLRQGRVDFDTPSRKGPAGEGALPDQRRQG